MLRTGLLALLLGARSYSKRREREGTCGCLCAEPPDASVWRNQTDASSHTGHMSRFVDSPWRVPLTTLLWLLQP